MRYLSVLFLIFTIAFAACLDRPAAYSAHRESCLSSAKTCEEYVACVKAFPDDAAPPVGSCVSDAGVE